MFVTRTVDVSFHYCAARLHTHSLHGIILHYIVCTRNYYHGKG